MNNILKYAAVILLGAGAFSSCSLDSESMSSIDSSTFPRTVADAEMSRVGCYNRYRRLTQSANFAYSVLSEVLSDDCFGGTSATDARNYAMFDRFDINQYPGGQNEIEPLWTYYYQAIFACNSFLQGFDNVEWESEAQRNRYEGEVRFLRAIEYFDLARMFGAVPLLTEPTTEVIPRTDPQEVFAQIVEDLVYAMKNIDYAPNHNWVQQNDGTATQYAAAAMLARVYLFYTGYYQTSDCPGVTKQQVIDGLNMVISSGYYGLVQSKEDGGKEYNGFTRLWRAACATDATLEGGTGLNNHAWVGRGSSESDVNEFIFTQKFNHTGSSANNGWLVMMGARSITDASAVPYGNGWGACTVNPDTWNIFEEGDPRREASIIDWIGEGRQGAYDEFAPLTRELTGYSIKKYTPLSYNVDGKAVSEVSAESSWEGGHSFQSNQYQDYIVIRYADVLLMLSELQENADGMNEVRARAGLAALPYSKENILLERHREFIGEGIRYWDLLRQGVDYAANAISGSWKVQSGGADDTVTINAQDILSKRGLLPIPSNQIILSNGIYTQNPGW